MQRNLGAVAAALGFCFAQGVVLAQQNYPRVVSPTGHFYGPTQAHYQYERQYGHPWYGGPAPVQPQTGGTFHFQGVAPFGAFGAGPGYYYGYGGVPGYGYGYSWQRSGFPLLGGGVLGGGYQTYSGYNGVVVAPGGAWSPYAATGPQLGTVPDAPFARPLADFNAAAAAQAGVAQQQALEREQFRPQPRVDVGAPQPVRTRPPEYLITARVSTPEQRARSIHLLAQGDDWLRQQNYLQAYSRYKQSAAAAPDQVVPRYRMALALVTLHQYDLAVAEMQRVVRMDPASLSSAEGLATVMGERNALAASSLLHDLVAWVREDYRDPERLFLLGAVLFLNNDHERALPMLQAADQLAQSPPWTRVFLNALSQGPAAAPNGAPASPDDRPPVPEAVEELLKPGAVLLPPQQKPAGPVERERQGFQPIPKRGANSSSVTPAGGTVVAPETKTVEPAGLETAEPVKPAKPAEEASDGPVLFSPQ